MHIVASCMLVFKDSVYNFFFQIKQQIEIKICTTKFSTGKCLVYCYQASE